MNSLNLEGYRSQLKNSFDLISTNSTVFPWRIRQFWTLLQHDPIWTALLSELKNKFKSTYENVMTILQQNGDIQKTLYHDLEEHAAASLAVITYCMMTNQNPWRCEKELLLGKKLVHSARNLGETLEHFTNIYLLPLYHYLDAKLEQRHALMYFLVRYKHLVEWFDRRRVFSIYETSEQPQEDHLALDAYRFLFLEGIDFHLAPNCTVGEIDFISELRREGRLLFDAKVYREGRSDIIKGFNQMLTYLNQYNYPWGCLLIYDVNSSHPLLLNFPLSDFGVSNVGMGGRTIFFLTIDIADRKTASDRGKLKPLIMEESHLFEPVIEDK